MNQENLDSFLDLVAYVGADLTKTSIAPSQEHLDENAQYELFREGVGRVLGVNMSMRKTLFVNGGGYVESSKEYLTRKADLEGALDSINKNEPLKMGRLRGRYSRLTGIHAAIYAGGHTQSEKENVKFLLEDSIAACRSVMRDGYTLGGNVTPLFALARLKDRLLAEDYEWCAKFLDPYFSQKEMKRSAGHIRRIVHATLFPTFVCLSITDEREEPDAAGYHGDGDTFQCNQCDLVGSQLFQLCFAGNVRTGHLLDKSFTLGRSRDIFHRNGH
jgi:hypothetical protein